MKKRRSAAAEHCVEHGEDWTPGGSVSAGWSWVSGFSMTFLGGFVMIPRRAGGKGFGERGS